MKIEFWFCREYHKKVCVATIFPNEQPLFTILDNGIVKDSVSEITHNTVVDNDFFMQDCGEFSCSVKFRQQLFDILFTKKAHPNYRKLSMYCIRVFDDADNNIFDGPIKFAGNTVAADKKTISFSAYDWLIFFNEIKPAESDALVDLHLIGYLHRYIIGHYNYYTDDTPWIGASYFKINEDGTNWDVVTLETFRLVDGGGESEPLTDFQTTDFLMSDNGSPFDCSLPDSYYAGLATLRMLTLAVGGFTQEGSDMYYHVLAGYSGGGIKCEYWKFQCYNIAEFEAIPDLFTGTNSVEYDYTYTTPDSLKTKLQEIIGAYTLTSSATYNGATYSITGDNTSMAAIFDKNEQQTILPGLFRLPITITGAPVVTVLKTQNKDLLAKALLFENRGLSVLGYTFSIKKKTDFTTGINDYTIIPKSKGLSWTLSTVEPEEFDFTVFDSTPGGNQTGGVSFLEYWAKQRFANIIKSVTTNLEYSTNQPVHLADVIVLEDMPSPIKFRVSEISFSPENPVIKNIVAYNISNGAALVSPPTILKSGGQVVMSAQAGAVIYYTFHATQQPDDPTGSSSVYSTPLNLVSGYYKARAKVGEVYSAVTCLQISPEMLNNAIIHNYLHSYTLTRNDEPETFDNMYIFLEDNRSNENVVCVIFNMVFGEWPVKMGYIRYAFIGNQFIDSSSGYRELSSSDIGSHLSAQHLVYIADFLALAGYTGAYDVYNLNTLTFTDNGGLSRNYNTVGWNNTTAPYMRYSGRKTY